MKIADVVKAAIPDASEADIDFVIWERTPFPMTKMNARDIYRAASGWNRAMQKGNRLCGWCERQVSLDEHTCERCRAIILG